jgi:hypothetical protein
MGYENESALQEEPAFRKLLMLLGLSALKILLSYISERKKISI